MKTLFVLASKSPRRKALLKSIGINAEIVPARIDESIFSGLEPEKMVRELAMLKAAEVARSFGKNTVVIGADTCVCLDNKVFGKPHTIEEAKSMLRMLQGKTHEVYTGYCVFDCTTKNAVSRSERTLVTFKSLSEEEIDAYVKTREPMDKAGAYGIQEKGAVFVEKIEGDYFNVVGLPLCALSKLLSEMLGISILG